MKEAIVLYKKGDKEFKGHFVEDMEPSPEIIKFGGEEFREENIFGLIKSVIDFGSELSAENVDKGTMAYGDRAVAWSVSFSRVLGRIEEYLVIITEKKYRRLENAIDTVLEIIRKGLADNESWDNIAKEVKEQLKLKLYDYSY